MLYTHRVILMSKSVGLRNRCAMYMLSPGPGDIVSHMKKYNSKREVGRIV